ncbi:hypothetical protein [Herpetosiphon geysericola]|uniref:Uncharacterized protein n=1 Tax=Herpetosiphon geysericola TaxID=70996 RepID=A0A0P6YUY9_9CHLR|nr:hypothetical protein [Herpetosiphon geysericola]KPL88897.1 hypothetical protein SE18_09530 [Herpetosiphon geysericola]
MPEQRQPSLTATKHSRSSATQASVQQQPQADPIHKSAHDYSVPASIVSMINAPQRWQRWVGYNMAGFLLSCGLIPAGNVFIVWVLDIVPIDVEHSLAMLDFSANAFLSMLIQFGVPLMMNISVVSLLQRSALDFQVRAKPWVIGSVLSGIAGFYSTLILIELIGDQLKFMPTLQLHILSIFTLCFVISTGIGLFQWSQLRSIASNAWHWPVISGATWISLTLLVLGLIAYVVSIFNQCLPRPSPWSYC